jgi:N-acetylated-alpha-linked acidic dipeptidase
MRLWSSLFLLALAAYAQAPAAAPIRGFPPAQWKAEHDREEQAKAIPQQERLRIYMDRLADKPHHAGSPGSKAVAEYLSAQLTEWGLDTRIETFEALIPYPTTRTLEMTAPVRFRAKLAEPPIPEDPSTSQEGQLPTFNAYGASGDVTAPLVYVNYGMPEDFAYLKKQGIDVQGKIAIARYGRSWRGLKPKLAQDNGAVGCLIYSDPREDGFFQNDVYPKGPMRPSGGVQRGSVMDMAIYPGDPLSPGWASEPNPNTSSKRLDRDEAKTLLKIPVLPISWADALPLLEQLGGQVVPESWRGALPLTYHAGPGPATVHLEVDFDWSTRPLYNVIATIPGSGAKDQWIMYGNHHDAWVNGASDPVSGASVLLETARTLSELRKQGWQPRRTVMLALWDGEEYGLLGSTEWVEKHMDELDRAGMVYLNSDSTGRGVLVSGGSASLEPFLAEVLRDVKDPATSKSLLEASRERRTAAATAGAAPAARGRRDRGFHVESLGSGSDYVAFLDHAGVASLNLGFGAGDGVYHSIYDTPAWYQQFSDGDRIFGKALTQVMTTAILRLADAPLLPFEFSSLSASVTRWVEEIRRELPRGNARVNLRPVTVQLTRLSAAAKAYDEELSAWTKRGQASSQQPTAPEKPVSEALAKVDESMRETERALLAADGLPGRDWYRNQIYAPGILTGYAAKTLPGVREAVEAQQWNRANQQTRKLAESLRAAAVQVEEAARLLKQAQ